MVKIWYWQEKQPVKRNNGETVSSLIERALQVNGSPELVGPVEYFSIGEFESQTGISCWRIQRATYRSPYYNATLDKTTEEPADLYSATSYEVGLQAEHAGFSFPA